MKKTILLTLALLAAGSFTASADESDQPVDAHFTGVFADSAADTDGDGIFEQLIIVAEVQINRPGRYCIEGSLAKHTDYLISSRPDWLSTSPLSTIAMDCEPGPVTFYLPFSGEDIKFWGFDTTYNALFSLYREPDSARHNEGVLVGVKSLGSHRHETAHYDHSQFGEFEGEITRLEIFNIERERAIDTSGNGLIDELEITVSILSTESIFFRLRADLRSDSIRIATHMELVNIRPGPNVVKLKFPGEWIEGSKQDGKYFVDVALTENQGNRFARKKLQTAESYNHADFELLKPHPSGAVRIYGP